jgi:lipid A 3-O-deacylase
MRVMWYVLLAASMAGEANAGVFEEVRFGMTVHNICVTDCENANKEDGPNLNVELDFASPGPLKALGSPHPYAMASLNTQGKTSFAATGLVWELRLGKAWRLETSFGYAVHNGELDFPFPQGDPRNNPVSAENVFLGSRDLLRTSLVVGRDLDERAGVEVVYEHYSHGQILGEGRNQGMDMLGLRLRFDLGE